MFELPSLNYRYNTEVESAYIIRIDGNEDSERLAQRCAKTCEESGQKYKFFKAIDGTSDKILFPDDYKDHDILKQLKLVNTTLTNGEVACFLSHFLLWVKCVELEQPIVILEHDAISIRPYTHHPFFNVVAYLGSHEQYTQTMPMVLPIPPNGRLNDNMRFMLRAHAYAIDPMVARQLVSNVIKMGIITSADVIFRIDQYSIIQDGLYAFDAPEGTTIVGRDAKTEEENIINCNNHMQFG